ncbi:MAG: diguanylate cyclase, partial [Eubacterium sp.]|nr:diguanylate cyclase [Eubacterium sp.]
MNFQEFVDGMGAMTCVVSVEKIEGGRYGDIRIVTGNKSYIESIEKPFTGVEMLTKKFVPNQLYTEYLTRDINFEEYCYQAAVHNKCLHSYAHPDRANVWFNMVFLPVSYKEDNIHYCTYTMEINFEASSKRLSNVSGEVASFVLESYLKLRNQKDFANSMSEVMYDFREMCSADYCGVVTKDQYEDKWSLLAENMSDRMLEVKKDGVMDDDFYELVKSWEQTIAGSNCLIAKNESDMLVIKERNPEWYESLMYSNVKSIVLFPLKNRDNEILGYMWVVNIDPDRALEIKELLELTTDVLASEINNYLLLKRLKTLSSRDMLTGVMNRNEMNNDVERILMESEQKSKSVGVIFTDLNGLKSINDRRGHVAGDKVLVKAAKI